MPNCLKMINSLLCNYFRYNQNFSFILRCNFHVNIPCNRWYKSLLSAKRTRDPPKDILVTANDWENEKYTLTSPSTYIKSIETLKGFEKLDERSKEMFTYAFVDRETEYNNQVNDFLRKLNYHPTDDSIGAKVIRMTVRLRYKKWLYDQNWDVYLKRSTLALIRARWRALRQLRLTDLSEFERLRHELNITDFVFPDPFYFGFKRSNISKKKSVREECYAMRITKITDLKTDYALSKHDFVKQKRLRLAGLLENLKSVLERADDADKESQKLIRDLFDSVVKERKVQANMKPDEDNFMWYLMEEEKRKQVLQIQAKKNEKAMRRIRK